MYSRWRERLHVIGRSVLLACIVASGIAVAQEGNSVRVVVETASRGNGALQELLGSTLAGAPRTIHSISTLSAVVSTNTIGYERLLSDPRFVTVRLLSGTAPDISTAPSTSAALTEWTIRLRTTASNGFTPDTIPAATDATAGHTAQIIAERTGEASIAQPNAIGPGMLVVRGLGADGGEVARAVVADPRLIRYEAAAADGELSGRRDFFRVDVLFNVTLPADARIASLEVAASDGGGGLRLLARAVAQ